MIQMKLKIIHYNLELKQLNLDKFWKSLQSFCLDNCV